ATAAADYHTGPVIIKGILWVGDNGSNLDIADGDQLDLHDKASGTLIISKLADAAGDGLELIFPKENWIHVEGLYVTTMAGGMLHILI
ncbi:unnamed protein product, partial [marine sediment metagenome]